MHYTRTFLPAAYLNEEYSYQIEVVGGKGPYTFSYANTPPGLFVSASGVVSGKPTSTGTTYVEVTAQDNAGEVLVARFVITVIEGIFLTDLTVDQTEFVAQLQEAVVRRGVWSVGLATMTSQTLIELISAVGTYETSKILRATEDAFTETAQAPAAIRAIATMQGLRLTRKQPAQLTVTMAVDSGEVVVPALTQFAAGRIQLFNTEELVLTTTPKPVSLKEGKISEVVLTGLGHDHQSFVSATKGFEVSDTDVSVSVNGRAIKRVTDGLWHYRGQAAFQDVTLPDGRLNVLFGTDLYGTKPTDKDTVVIRYAVTLGSAANRTQSGAALTSAEVPSLKGFVGTIRDGVRTFNPPAGGLDERGIAEYKYLSPGAMGTFSSAITKGQYQAVVTDYPSVVDALAIAQRDIDATDVRHMNRIYVGAVTATPWTEEQKAQYIESCERRSVWGPVMVWKEPESVPIKVHIKVLCCQATSSLNAIRDIATEAVRTLFKPKLGFMTEAIYISDIQETVRSAASGNVRYVEVLSPTSHLLPERGSIRFFDLQDVVVDVEYSA